MIQALEKEARYLCVLYVQNEVSLTMRVKLLCCVCERLTCTAATYPKIAENC